MKVNWLVEARRAWRRLLSAPAFSVGVLVLMALSIGCVAAVATAGWSLFVQPLPYAQPDRLVNVSVTYRERGFRMGLSAALVERLNVEEAFGTLAIVERPTRMRLREGGMIRAGRIDHRLLETLGIAPLAGRGLGADDVVTGAEPVALISRRFWVSEFGGDAAALGRGLELESGRVRVVGVLPDHFAMPESNTDLWLSMQLDEAVLAPQRLSNLLSHTIVARLPGAQTPARYREHLLARLADLDRLGQRLRDGEIDLEVRPLRELWSGDQVRAWLILAAAAAMVLAATWLNLAGLWLARWAGKTHELAIQLALGARSGAASAGVVLEYLVLAVPGLLLAAGVSALTLEMLYALGALVESGPLRAGSIPGTFATGSVLIGSGLAALLASMHWTLKRLAQGAARGLGGRSASARSGGLGMRRLLMVGQVGIAFALTLVVALLLTSWLRLLDEDLGFDADRLAVAMVGTSTMGDSTTDLRVAAAAERLAGLPGVAGVSWSNAVPFGGLEFISGVMLDDQPNEAVEARSQSVGPNFFRTAGINVLSGRSFGVDDVGEAAQTVIVDRAFEQRYLDGAALGRRIGYPNADSTIIGVVESVRHESPDEPLEDRPTLYRYSAEPPAQTQLLVRTSLDPESIVAPVHQALEADLGARRVFSVVSLESRIRQSVRDREPQLILIATFAGLALVLVFYGLYALQSYQVAMRIAEIGLRRAIGASSVRILGSELTRAAWLIPPGLVLGAFGAWLGARLISVHLYKTGLDDAGLWLATGIAIATTIALAGLVPALRASRIEPMEALRHE